MSLHTSTAIVPIKQNVSVHRPFTAQTHASADSNADEASLDLVELIIIQVVVIKQLLFLLGELDAGNWSCCAATTPQ